MTKYEWERQLKKGISGLPKAEQQRVLDYYNELFADKIDAGLREQYIISEFGNPYDVANKILVDYYNGDKENPEVDAYIYADSDDIDEEFDEEPVKTVETPKRKTWTERKEERREEQNARHEEQQARHEERREKIHKGIIVDDFSDDAENDAEATKKKSKGVKSASGLIVLLCVLAYCVLGAFFNLWHPGWLIFLLIPCVITLIEAIARRNWKIFAYPVFATLLFFVVGYYVGDWHPTWVIFVTIPVYYALGNFITKNVDKDNTKKSDKTNNKDDDSINNRDSSDSKQESKKVKSDKRSSAASVITIIAKVLMTICFVWVSIVVWSFVISVFCGGIGLVVSGVLSLIAAVAAEASALGIGLGLAQLGLGFICVFGMMALFKPCFNMCKSFVKTVKNSFDKEVA